MVIKRIHSQIKTKQTTLRCVLHFRLQFLVLFAFVLAFAFNRVDSDFFIILLQCSQILTSLRELALLHALTDIPVHERTLGVHQVKLVVKSSPGLGDGSGVAQHADSTLHLGQVTAWHHGRRLVVDSHLNTANRELQL